MAISERDVLLLYCIKICPAIVRGVNIALHMNIHPYNHLFLWSFQLCYHTAYVYMKIKKAVIAVYIRISGDKRVS